jgi:hypothetical protein
MGRGLTRTVLVLALLPCACFAVAADAATGPQAIATGVIVVDASAAPGTPPVASPGASLAGPLSVTTKSWASSGSTPLAQADQITSSVSSSTAGLDAQTSLTNVQLFGGELTIDSLQVSVKQPPTGAEIVNPQVGNVQLGGSPVSVPARGAGSVPLSDWGQLSVGPTLKDGSVAGLLIDITADHDSLVAGSSIVIGDVQVVPAPQSSGGGGGGGGGGSSAPPPAPTLHHHHHAGKHHAHHHARAHHRHHGPIDETHPVKLPKLGNGVRAAIVRAAAAQIGWPYVWGGESRAEGGFDCSGLVDYAFLAAGHPLPGRPTAAVLWHMGIPIKKADLRPGDLAFLGTNTGEPYHVALYAGDGMVIVASHHGAPIAEVPLDSVPWDGYARIWAPGGYAPVIHPRTTHGGNPDELADAIAFERARQSAPASDSANVVIMPPPPPVHTLGHRAPARHPGKKPESPVIIADPRARAAQPRSAFPLPSA